MTVCTDVYVRPQTCDVIRIYPSQVHPFVPPPSGGGGGGHPWPERGRDFHEDRYREYPRRPKLTDDEEIAVLIALGLM